MSAVQDATEALQQELEGADDYEQGDVVVEFITVAVFQNFETGRSGTFVMTSSEPDSGFFPAYRAKGLLTDGLDIIREGEQCRCGGDD